MTDPLPFSALKKLREAAAPLAAGGVPLGATASERMAALAVMKGYLTAPQLEEAIAEQGRRSAAGKPQNGLEQILVERGWLNAERLMELVRELSPRAEEIPELERYEIGERLGEGATGHVYRARDRTIDRPVAVKFLKAEFALHEVVRRRFLREGKTAGGLSHPNVVTVYDVGEAEGRPYLVMELVEGRSLAHVLAERKTGRMDLVRLLSGAARGVAAAHEKGIVHRDLKPANILITASGEPKVADFGLAHLIGSDTGLTRTGATLGTPLYMAPEQARGESGSVAAPCDVYALGATLYELSTGRTPFSGDTFAEILARMLSGDPPSPRSVDPTVPRELEAIILRAMEREPSRRYADARQFADDLDRYLAGERVKTRRTTNFLGVRLSLTRFAAIAALSIGALVVAAMVITAKGPPQPPKVETRAFRWTHQGFSAEEIAWSKDAAERMYGELSKLTGLELKTRPAEIEIKKGPPGGVSGWASAPRMGVAVDDWRSNRWCLWILAHEMTNLILSEGVSGGWPVDWWTNQRSPFPLVTSNEILRNLGWRAEAEENMAGYRNDALVQVFVKWVRRDDMGMFRKAFALMREDEFEWYAIGANPSALRTHYMLAYLSLGAGENVAGDLSSAVPPGLFTYAISSQEVSDIMRARARMAEARKSGDRDRGRRYRTAFLTGNYAAVLKE